MHLQKALSTIGLKVIGNKEPDLIRSVDDHVEVTFKDGTKLQAEMLLYALGREANVDRLQIDNVGLLSTKRDIFRSTRFSKRLCPTFMRQAM